MLKNKKYKGNALLQKIYTIDFLTNKRIDNDGQVNQYYIENNISSNFISFRKKSIPLQQKYFVPNMVQHLADKIGLQVEVNVRFGCVIIDIGIKAKLDV